MIKHTNEEIVKKLHEIFTLENINSPKIEVLRNDTKLVSVTISQMYEYIQYNLKQLLQMSEFFGTQNINDSRYSSPGCDTCDYGSSYEVTFDIKPA